MKTDKFKEDEMSGDIKGTRLKTGEDYTIIYIRCFFAVVVALLFFTTQDMISTPYIFFETYAILIVYTVLSTIYMCKQKKNAGIALIAMIYIDIAFASIFCFQLGGVNSDIYIIILFLEGFNVLFNIYEGMWKLCVYGVVLYTISCMFAGRVKGVDLNYTRLVFRNAFLILASFGPLRFNREIKKYNELHKKEFVIARTDRLTGLANRHYFDQKLKEEVEYSLSTGNPINILIFDIDNFKNFNDAYGHIMGDKLLMLFSDIIRQNIRKTDIPVRYGGEEFLILIRDLDIILSKSVGERIRRQLEKQRLSIGSGEDKKRVTVSCGIAQYPRHSTDINRVIEYADKALYYAKETGKNNIAVFDELMEADDYP